MSYKKRASGPLFLCYDFAMFRLVDQPYPDDIKPLTSLRFFAALAVVVFHYRMLLPFSLDGYSMLPAKGYLAVDFFFILSGFILSHAYLSQIEARKLRLRDFYIKRLARIYPVHAATLLLSLAGTAYVYYAGFSGEWPSWFSWKTLLSNVFMLHGWGVESELSFNKPSWSISAEWFAYLLFPFLGLWLLRLRPVLVLTGGAVLFGLLYYLFWRFWTRPVSEVTFDLGFLRILPEFVCGMALYRLGQKFKIGAQKGVLALCVVLILALGHFGAPDYVIIPLFGVLIMLAAEKARAGRDGVLADRTLLRLGEASYSLYMIHYLLMEAVFLFGVYYIYGETVSIRVFYPLWFLMFLAVIPLSLLFYHFIEKPGRRWVTRFQSARE